MRIVDAKLFVDILNKEARFTFLPRSDYAIHKAWMFKITLQELQVTVNRCILRKMGKTHRR